MKLKKHIKILIYSSIISIIAIIIINSLSVTTIKEGGCYDNFGNKIQELTCDIKINTFYEINSYLVMLPFIVIMTITILSVGLELAMEFL